MFQQQRRQLTDCAFQWAELQEIILGEESDLHDNRILFDERNQRGARRQVSLQFSCHLVGSRASSLAFTITTTTFYFY